MSETDRQPVVQGFLECVRRARVYAVLEPTGQGRRAFVPKQKLLTYFTDPDSQRLVEILEAVFFPEDPPLFAENVVPKYAAVLAILLHINKAQYIKEFTEHSALSDDRLPFVPNEPPPKFPISTGDPNFYSRFCDEQWKFCAPTFQRHMLDEQFEGERVLPITFKEKLGGGGSGTLYKIKIHKLYNELVLDESKAKLGEESANTFVLKTYITDEARKYYANEVAAFFRLRPTPNIIEFYGSYIHGDSFNVLLEFADKGNLEQYFKEQPEPRTGEDILKFWRSIFMLGQALTGIHQVKPRASTDGPPIFQGWHQDIKPENILIVSNYARSPYDWYFKLSDLGLSHFIKVVSSGEPTASDVHGTRTYGAPECYRADDWVEQSDITVKQNVDIWSLGCVYSEAARWVAGGYNGIKEFRAERKAETDLIRNFRDGDCFHNGEKALKAVHRSHKKTCDSLARHDYITEHAINIMIKEMLDTFVGRPTATQVWIKSQRILGEAQEMLDQVREDVTRARGQTFPQHPPKLPQPAVLPPGVSRDPHQQPKQEGVELGRMIETGDDHHAQVLDGEYNHSPDGMSEDRNDNDSSLPARHGLGGKTPTRAPRPHHHVSDGQVQYRGTGDSFSDEDQLNQNTPTRQSNYGGTANRRRVNSKSVSFDTHPTHNSAPDLQTGTIDFDIVRSTTGSLTRGSRDLDRGKGRTTTSEPESYLNNVTPNQDKSSGSGSSPQSNLSNHRQGDWHKSKMPGPASPTSQSSSPQATNSQQEVRHRRETSHGSSSAMSQREVTGQQTTTSEPELANGQLPEELPSFSVKDAIAWKEEKKEKKRKGEDAQLKDKYLVARLEERDHIFVVDDSKSMEPYWEELKIVFEALSYMVKDCDPNGTDLYFTVSKDHKRDTDTSEFLKMLNRKHLGGMTDIEFRLNEILDKYKAKLDEKPSLVSSFLGIGKKEPRSVRPLSIYILTSGRWEPRSTGETPIINLVKTLKKLGKTKSQVGIQFISFGNYAVGLRKMQNLDSGLGRGRKKEDWLDVVDTTPSDGNVWKMLLGAINSSYDDDPDLTEEIDEDRRYSGSMGPTSPVSPHKFDES